MLATTVMSKVHSQNLLKKRERALSYDLLKITDRFANTHKASREIAELLEVECKKYLLLCALFPGESLGMKGNVDNYWHTFLLFTKEYSRFCNEIAGFFIHHVPSVSHTLERGSFARTMALYRETFGIEPDPRAWGHWEMRSAGADVKDDCSTGPGDGDCTPTSDCNGGKCSSDGN